MSSSTIPNACPGLRVSSSPGPSSSATSTKSTSPTCERGWQGSSRQDKRGSNYLRTNRQPTSEKAIFQRFVKLSMRTQITNSVKSILMGSSFPGIETSSSILQCKFPPFSAKLVHPSVNLPSTTQRRQTSTTTTTLLSTSAAVRPTIPAATHVSATST